MEKTYKLLEHAESLPIADIRRIYHGYWVYIVKATLDERGRIERGIPAVIGTVPYDGSEDNIYDKYRTEEYEVRVGINLLTNTGIVSVFRIEGEC